MVNDTNDLPTDTVDIASGGLLADPPVRGLVYHALLFTGVVLVLLAINLMFMPDFLWVQWIALLWGVLLAWNLYSVLSSRRGRAGQR